MNKKALFKQSEDSVVFLASNKQTAEGPHLVIEGTGFVIGDGTVIVTCNHVFQQLSIDSAKVYVRELVKGLPSYRAIDFIISKKDEENDLVILKLKNEKLKPLKILNTIAETGEETITIGFPLPNDFLQWNFGATVFAQSGMVASIKRKTEDGSVLFYLLDHHVNRGLSGSPVISLETGEVIGVASNTINYSVTVDSKVTEIPKNIGLCRQASLLNKLI